MPLPSRLFYTLEEAAIELSKNSEMQCSVNDLLHFAARGSFEPLLFVDGKWEGSAFSGVDSFNMQHFTPMLDSNDPSDIFITGRKLKHNLFESDLCEIWIDISTCEDDEHNEKNNEYIYPIDLYEVSISGLMAFKPLMRRLSFFNRLINTGSVDIDSNSVFLFIPHTIHSSLLDDDDPKEFCNILMNYFFISFASKTIKSTDIYISNKELKILGEGGRQENDKDMQKEIPNVNKLVMPTENTKSKCSEFIRNILYLYYKNNELKDKPWLLVRDDRSKGKPTEMEEEFISLGLTLPSRKSIKRWTEEK